MVDKDIEWQELISVANPLPNTTTFIELQELETRPSDILSYFALVIFLLASVVMWLHNAPNAAVYTSLLMAAIGIPNILRDRVLLHRFNRKDQRWGIFLSKNKLLYRHPRKVIALNKAQIEKVVQTSRQKGGKTTLELKIIYRNKLHLPQQSFEIDDAALSNGVLLLKEVLDTWQKEAKDEEENSFKAKADKIEAEAWGRQYQRIASYSRWLPKHVIDAIPKIPCTTEERMGFIETLKPYRYRMQLADLFNRGMLASWGTSSLWLAFLFSYTLLIETLNSVPIGIQLIMGGIFVLPCVLILAWIYVLFLHLQWQERRFRVGQSLLSSFIFLFANMILTSALVFITDIVYHFIG